ncbi:hypothetical protein P9477_23225 [Enterobacter mori]|uniref:hypothetical protein n=1 Tax=Enterobacter mori TaxID=539813 RepID=UPI00398A8752
MAYNVKDFPQWEWIDLYSDDIKEPHSYKRKFYFQCEKFINDKQLDNIRSCFYKGFEKRIDKSPRKNYLDMLGNIIQHDDILFLPDKDRKKGIHCWKVICFSGTKAICQCLTPGYDHYRTKLNPSLCIVLTGTLKENLIRKNAPKVEFKFTYV